MRRTIADLRAHLGMKQAEFASLIGVGTSTLQGYEREDVPRETVERCREIALERGFIRHAKVFEAEVARQTTGAPVDLDLRPEMEVLDRIEKMVAEIAKHKSP